VNCVPPYGRVNGGSTQNFIGATTCLRAAGEIMPADRRYEYGLIALPRRLTRLWKQPISPREAGRAHAARTLGASVARPEGEAAPARALLAEMACRACRKHQKNILCRRAHAEVTARSALNRTSPPPHLDIGPTQTTPGLTFRSVCPASGPFEWRRRQRDSTGEPTPGKSGRPSHRDGYTSWW